MIVTVVSKSVWRLGGAKVAWWRWTSGLAIVSSIPGQAKSGHLGQLGLLSLRGKQIEYQPSSAGVNLRGAFACVGWQVTLCDPIWQATPCSFVMGSPIKNLLWL